MMRQNKIYSWLRRVPGILTCLTLIAGQTQAETRFSNKTCENYQDDLTAVDQYLRGRELEVPGATPSKMTIGAIEEKRAKLYAQRALIEGIELLRQRMLSNLAYLKNDKHCDFYAKKDEQEKCRSGKAEFPKQSFFELQNAEALKQLEGKIEDAKLAAKNVYGMEQTIGNLLGSPAELNTFLTADKPKQGVLAAKLVEKCGATSGSRTNQAKAFCEILKAPGSYKQLVDVLDNFGNAFYLGYKYKMSDEPVAKAAAAQEAQAALTSFQAKLKAEPLKGGQSLLGVLMGMDNLGNAVHKRYLESIECVARRAPWNDVAVPTGGISEVKGSIQKATQGKLLRTLTATEAQARIEQLKACEVTNDEKNPVREKEQALRAHIRQNLGITDAAEAEESSKAFSLSSDYVLGNSALDALMTKAESDTLNHRHAVTAWLNAHALNDKNKSNARPYLFDKGDKAAGDSLKKLLLQTANRAMIERKIKGSDRKVGADLLKAEDLNNDAKLAKHFLKQILLYQADLFGTVTTSCPSPTLLTEVAIDKASDDELLTGLHTCLSAIENGADKGLSFSAQKVALEAELAKLKLAADSTSNPEVNKTKELREKLAILVQLKCHQSSMTCVASGKTSLDGADDPIRYLVSSSGNVLAHLDPKNIASASSENGLRSEISSLCSASIPVAPPGAPTNLRTGLPRVCQSHDPVFGAAIVPTQEYSREEQKRTQERLSYLEDHHVTYLPDGTMATSSKAAGWGSPLILGTATAFATVIAPTLWAIPGMEAQTTALEWQAKGQIYQTAWNQQVTDYYMANGGAFAFGAPFAPFAMPTYGYAATSGFNAGGDAGYAGYLMAR